MRRTSTTLLLLLVVVIKIVTTNYSTVSPVSDPSSMILSILIDRVFTRRQHSQQRRNEREEGT